MSSVVSPSYSRSVTGHPTESVLGRLGRRPDFLISAIPADAFRQPQQYEQQHRAHVHRVGRRENGRCVGGDRANDAGDEQVASYVGPERSAHGDCLPHGKTLITVAALRQGRRPGTPSRWDNRLRFTDLVANAFLPFPFGHVCVLRDPRAALVHRQGGNGSYSTDRRQSILLPAARLAFTLFTADSCSSRACFR